LLISVRLPFRHTAILPSCYHHQYCRRGFRGTLADIQAPCLGKMSKSEINQIKSFPFFVSIHSYRILFFSLFFLLHSDICIVQLVGGLLGWLKWVVELFRQIDNCRRRGSLGNQRDRRICCRRQVGNRVRVPGIQSHIRLQNQRGFRHAKIGERTLPAVAGSG